MPAISDRGGRMPPSPIRKLVPFAEKAAKAGKHIYYLNIGQPDIETPPSLLEAVRKADIRVLAYSHSAGNESYRRKITDYYRRFNINISVPEVMITTGGSEAILFGFMSCLDPGDEIIIPEPFYANYNGFATAAGVVIRPVTSHIENGFALPPVSEFERLITSRTRAVLVCNPNNPTGYLYSAGELESLKNLVLKHDLFLFADEVYREFCYDGKKHVSVLHLDGLDRHAVLFDSISKRYSACGARIGCLVSKNREVMDTALRFAQARLSPPTLEQIAAEAAVDVPESYFKKVHEEYELRRNLLVSMLNKMEGVVCPLPGGAFYATVRLPIDDADRFCRWMLEEYEYKGGTVMMAPGSGFYNTPGAGKDEVRIAYVLKEEDLRNAMECLEAALKAYPGSTRKKNTSSQIPA